jgi:glutamyl-tRNA synthetase
MKKNVRTRFAPSPTGFMHVGGVRTALFGWLVARQAGGQFILRLEDTDKKREVAGADKHIIDSLKALGLTYDEGPDVGGPYGPYRQSERTDNYKLWAQQLIDRGRAYADPYTAQEVQVFRDQASRQHQPFLYRNHRPNKPTKWNGQQPLRFKSEPKAYTWNDKVMGEISTGPEVIDDFILIKTDGYPTYNFAHIVDDAEMKISHIIRGGEFLASVPNYLNLYEALGLKIPIMATLPHILGPDGKKKLSKRDGAKDVLDYMHEGYLAEALISFIATLGWNDGTEQEVFTMEELLKKFSLDRIHRSGAHFDDRRLMWVNGHFIRQLSLGSLYDRASSFWPIEAKNADESYKKQILSLVQERLKYFAELPQLTKFFFVDLPIDPNLIAQHKQLKKLSKSELIDLLKRSRLAIEDSDFSEADLVHKLNELLEATGQRPVILFSLIRIATTQVPASPELAQTMAVLGKVRSLRRIDEMIASL